MQRLYDIVDKYLRTAWRRRWLALIAAWAVCALGWAFVAQMPNQFESTARIFVEADAFLTPLLRGLAADVNTSNQLEVIQRTLLSQPNMDKLIRMTDLESRGQRREIARTADPESVGADQAEAANQKPCFRSPIATRTGSWRATWCRRC